MTGHAEVDAIIARDPNAVAYNPSVSIGWVKWQVNPILPFVATATAAASATTGF